MSNIFDQGAMVSNLTPSDSVPVAEPGTVRIIARGDRLKGVLPNGEEVNFSSPLVLKDGEPLAFSPSSIEFKGSIEVEQVGDSISLQFPKIDYFETVTGANGAWSIVINGFTRVDFVTPVAIDNTASLSEISFATLQAFSETAANGHVLESNTLVFLIGGGGDGLQFAESGVRVRVRVEGI
ncbi:hypothetical protein [Limnobacter sp.]|uniref:hypothetical protein n=1 Tax=Limnobacter sp. TaxID=2003368 RepID=UPI0025B858D7|nr:hypothetical protein [Limnobacter sp.]